MSGERDYSGKISFRSVTNDDYDFLYRLHVTTMKEYVEQTWGWDEDLQQGYFKKGFKAEELQIISFENNDIGMISIENREDEVFLRSIEINSGYQKRGIGSFIIERMIKDAGRGGKPVSLYVLKVNPARRLYERLGFEIVNETATHYIM